MPLSRPVYYELNKGIQEEKGMRSRFSVVGSDGLGSFRDNGPRPSQPRDSAPVKAECDLLSDEAVAVRQNWSARLPLYNIHHPSIR